MVTVVKVVSGDGELRMRVYTSASDKKECVGEKGGRTGLKKRVPIPGKLREDFQKTKCRGIYISMLGQNFRENTLDLAVV